MELKTSEEWSSSLRSDLSILDPDGWDRVNFNYSFYEEKITKQEFEKRVLNSTIIMPADMNGIWKQLK